MRPKAKALGYPDICGLGYLRVYKKSLKKPQHSLSG
jgi:hypothetical protein